MKLSHMTCQKPYGFDLKITFLGYKKGFFFLEMTYFHMIFIENRAGPVKMAGMGRSSLQNITILRNKHILFHGS